MLGCDNTGQAVHGQYISIHPVGPAVRRGAFGTSGSRIMHLAIFL